MSVENIVNKAGPFTGNGLQSQFPFSFQTLDAAHVSVYVDEVKQDSGYEVTLLEDGSGGTVAFANPPMAGAIVTILREVPVTQLTDIQNNTAFLPETLETMADKLTMICQQLTESVSRCVRVPAGSAKQPEDYWGAIDSALDECLDAVSRAEAAAAACEDVADDTSIAWHNNAVDAHPAMMTAHRTARGAHPPEYLTGADYNTLTQSGDYYVSPGDGAPNAPDNFSYMVHVAAYEQTSWGRVFQTATRYVTGSAIPRTYTRVGTRATTGGEITWTAWEPLSYRDASGNILSDTYATRADPQLTGTVTFTTGNYATQLFVSSPQGSSRNRLYVDSDLYVDGFIKCLPAGSGSYIKLADGSVIQRGTMSVADSLLSLNVTFPYAFSMTPTVLLTDMHSESVHNHWIVSNVSETGFGAVMDRWDSEQGKADFCWVAIGQ